MALGDDLRQRAYGLGNWWRRRVADPADRFRQALPDIPSSPTEFLSNAEEFGGSIADAISEGYNSPDAPPQGSVGSDGIPSLLKRDPLVPEPLEIEKALEGRMFEQERSPAHPMTVEQGVAASTPQPVMRYKIGGGDWQDYGEGDRAPSLFDREAGPVRGLAFGKEYSPAEGGGAVTQLNPIPEAHKSLAQVQEEKARADAMPASNPTVPGQTVAQARTLAEEIAKREAEERAKIASAVAIERGKAGVQREDDEQRRGRYEQESQRVDAEYAAAVAAIEGSALAPEEKIRRKGLADSRYEDEKELLDKSFGVGYGISGVIPRT